MKEQFEPVRPGDPITAAGYNQLQDAVQRLDGSLDGPGMQGMLLGPVGGRAVPLPTRVYLVRLTASIAAFVGGTPDGTTNNAFILHYNSSTNDWIDSAEAIHVTNPYTDVSFSSGARIPVYFNRQTGKWLPFKGAAGLTIEYSDGTGVVSNVNMIKLQVDDFTLTDQGGGVVLVQTAGMTGTQVVVTDPNTCATKTITVTRGRITSIA